MPVSKGRKKAKKRPTPPSKPAVTEEKQRGASPIWYVGVMFGLMVVGIIVILLNYIDVMPGGTSNLWLLLGLGGIGVGFAMTLNYR